MSKLNKFRKSNSDEEGVWSSISDIMSGLMIVFLFIAISFMSKVADENIEMKKEKATIEKVVQTYEDTKASLYNDLYEEFKDDFEKWNMRIERDGTVRFLEPEVFFEVGQSTLKPQFQEILNDFFPRYIYIVNEKYKDKIVEVRIEGHTSSEWDGSGDEMVSYFANMELSQNRTRNVLQYVMNLENCIGYRQWLIEKITANGMSYSNRIMDENGVENTEQSRRVEFRIITNSEEIVEEVVNEYQK